MAAAAIRHNPMVYQSLSSSSSSDHGFPMLVIAVLSIISTALLLFFYYFFVNRCCSSNWHQRIITPWRDRRRNEDSFIALSPATWMNRGLDESVIREIPMFQYRKEAEKERSLFYECTVCLSEFQEMDMVRVLPHCSHSFHLDCIDIWLQSNANCPLCRTSISGSTKYPVDHIIAPSSSPQGSETQPYSSTVMGSDEDFVVIELSGDQEEGVLLPCRQQERDSLTEAETTQKQKCQSPAAKVDQQKTKKLKPRKQHHVWMMGDECIDTREKDEQFSVQPIRRSFSLDSAVDQQLYSSVQAIIQQYTHQRNEESSNRSVETSFQFKCQGRETRNTTSFGL